MAVSATEAAEPPAAPHGAGSAPAGDAGRAAAGTHAPGALAPDVLLVAYLLVSAVLALAGGSRAGLELAAAHAAGAALVVLLARRPLPGGSALRFLRIALPLVAIPVLYAELRVLDQLLFHGYFDATVQGWERTLFGTQLSLAAVRALPYAWLSEILHAGYFSYYLIVPTAALGAYLAGGDRGLERLTLTVSLAFFVCYLCFAVFPVAGPRYLFPPLEGAPARGPVYALVHTVVEGGSSKGTAFPSSHVAASVSALLGTWRDARRTFWILLLPVTALVIGTVYGRFHYGVDALSGLVVAATVFPVVPWLFRRLGGGAARP